jgi:hypothetical protein
MRRALIGARRLSAFHHGACGSEPTPPLSSRTHFLGRGFLQALPEVVLSQSSDLSRRPVIVPAGRFSEAAREQR